jgi:hypothetical protein
VAIHRRANHGGAASLRGKRFIYYILRCRLQGATCRHGFSTLALLAAVAAFNLWSVPTICFAWSAGGSNRVKSQAGGAAMFKRKNVERVRPNALIRQLRAEIDSIPTAV